MTIDFFISPSSAPFSIALLVVGALFVLEVISALAGASLLGIGTDSLDVEIDTDFDLSADIGPEFGADAATATEALEAGEASAGLFTWIGARDVPFLIWLVSFLTLFGLVGLGLQLALINIFGVPAPALLAAALACLPALAVTRVIANWVALIMPRTETTALRARHLGGYHGTVTQGTAQRGRPAEVKIKDRHGNLHYIRVEPLHDDVTFTQGDDVTLIRKRGDKFFVI